MKKTQNASPDGCLSYGLTCHWRQLLPEQTRVDLSEISVATRLATPASTLAYLPQWCTKSPTCSRSRRPANSTRFARQLVNFKCVQIKGMHGLWPEQDVVSNVHYVVNRRTLRSWGDFCNYWGLGVRSHELHKCTFQPQGLQMFAAASYLLQSKEIFEMNRLIVDSCYCATPRIDKASARFGVIESLR